MLTDKIKAVNKLYRQIDKHTAVYRRRTGLSCLHGCGDCCLVKNLDTTVTEFLPAAFYLYRTDTYSEVLEKIENKTDSVCVFFNPFGMEGNCSVYTDRGLICRLFGFTAKTDKNGNKSLITCKKIKSSIAEKDEEMVRKHAPNMTSYYMRLYGIDPSMSVKYLPINEAIKEAIYTVVFYSGFKKRGA